MGRKASVVIAAFWLSVLDVKARTLCRTLAEHVQPAVVGLMPRTSDEQAESKIKQELLQLLSRQKLVVNALYGTVDTRELSSMQNEFPENNPVVNPTPAPLLPADEALSALSSAGIADKIVIELVEVADSSLLGRTLYGQLAGLIVIHQTETQPYESQTAQDVREPAAQCSSPAPPGR